ncbi:DUF3450 domain-containing protein [Poseidonibacter lekithochrous]|uniref:DUF3450 domain-containing protein n=1 Tax=Poseidonibacter lekithochrous TaxID=1904463 RepID=UPI0008FC57C8|nr:DUF3450 domain-containing protein [Poseidonibacter lekithochrous]QKJ21861.1 DUF3450 domain-containing protein [Poseidonibacter lekithochrous]
MRKMYKTLFVLASLQLVLFANQIDKSVTVIEKTNNQLKSYQRKIDKNEDIREGLLNEYKYTNSSIKSTKTYNEQLRKIISSQETEIASLDQQIIDIEQTQKNIFPLMINMIKSLETLVNQDTPFLLTERLDRVKRLESTLNKADIQTHEKYRIILEAFKIEYDYAKTIEAYQDKINDKTYNFLRLGRVALYYQSLDLKEYGYYNKETQSWDIIEDSVSKSNIRKAIKIAKKQQNVDFLNLPFLAKKESK